MQYHSASYSIILYSRLIINKSLPDNYEVKQNDSLPAGIKWLSLRLRTSLVRHLNTYQYGLADCHCISHNLPWPSHYILFMDWTALAQWLMIPYHQFSSWLMYSPHDMMSHDAVQYSTWLYCVIWYPFRFVYRAESGLHCRDCRGWMNLYCWVLCSIT